MPDATVLSELARQMKRAQDEAQQIEPFSIRVDGFDVASAYDVAYIIHRERLREGAIPVGRKIGFTNPAMWALYGVREPIWAHIYDTTVEHLDNRPATCRINRFVEPKLEPEIVFHFRESPPANGDLAAILASIDWVAHGFEIVQSHFHGWKFQAADTVADWALHGTLLVGVPRPIDGLGPDLVAKLEQFSASLYCNGALREVGTGANVLGSPLRAIAHLVATLQRQPAHQPIRAGELVTTGTITTAQAIDHGDCWHTEVQSIALPGLSVTFLR